MIEKRKINGIVALKSYKPAHEAMSIGDGLSHLGDRKNDGTTVCLGIVAENVASGQYFYYYPLGTDGVMVAAGEILDLDLNSALKYVSGSGWLNAESADPVSAIVSEPVDKNDPANEVAAGEYVYVSLDAYYNGGAGGGGEANTASNVGSGGVGLFKQKLSSTLQFKNINAGSTKITITDDTGDDEVDIDVDESELTHANIGSLDADDHTQYTLLLGRSGGQSLIGGTDASDDLTLASTSNATKGQIVASSDINIDSGYSLLFNGADINTGGTLDNVAYLDQANTFTATNVFNMVDNTESAFSITQSTNEYITIDTLNGSEVLELTVGGATPSISIAASSVTINDDMTFTDTDIILSTTTNASKKGILYKSSSRFLHDFNYGDNGTVTTIGRNIFLGYNSGNLTMGSTGTNATHGSNNIGIGYNTLANNTTGYQNICMGSSALSSNSSGYRNVIIGNSACASTTTGFQNVSIGESALSTLSTGNNNVSVGAFAGRYITGGSTSLTTSTSSIFIGENTKANDNSEENQIVIGYSATGLGSNTVVLGNSSNTITSLTGNVAVNATIAGWHSSVNAIELEDSNIYSIAATDIAISNAYWDGTNYKYKTTGDEAHLLTLSNGGMLFRSATDGTADANITLATLFRVHSDGNVGIGLGDSLPTAKLHIYESTAADIDVLTARSDNSNVISHTFLGADTVSPTKPYYSVGMHASEDIFTLWLNDGTSDIDALSVGLDGTIGVDSSIMFTEVTSAPDDPTDGAEARIYVKDDKLVIQYNDSATIRYKYLDLTGTGVTWVHTTTPV
jgi:hypothetical protein